MSPSISRLLEEINQDSISPEIPFEIANPHNRPDSPPASTAGALMGPKGALEFEVSHWQTLFETSNVFPRLAAEGERYINMVNALSRTEALLLSLFLQTLRTSQLMRENSQSVLNLIHEALQCANSNPTFARTLACPAISRLRGREQKLCSQLITLTAKLMSFQLRSSQSNIDQYLRAKIYKERATGLKEVNRQLQQTCPSQARGDEHRRVNLHLIFTQSLSLPFPMDHPPQGLYSRRTAIPTPEVVERIKRVILQKTTGSNLLKHILVCSSWPAILRTRSAQLYPVYQDSIAKLRAVVLRARTVAPGADSTEECHLLGTLSADELTRIRWGAFKHITQIALEGKIPTLPPQAAPGL